MKKYIALAAGLLIASTAFAVQRATITGDYASSMFSLDGSAQIVQPLVLAKRSTRTWTMPAMALMVSPTVTFSNSTISSSTAQHRPVPFWTR
jgi:hypothetical protein